MAYKIFDKKSKGSGIENDIKEIQGNFLQNSQLANELDKPIINKFKKEKCVLLLKAISGVLI